MGWEIAGIQYEYSKIEINYERNLYKISATLNYNPNIFLLLSAQHNPSPHSITSCYYPWLYLQKPKTLQHLDLLRSIVGDMFLCPLWNLTICQNTSKQWGNFGDHEPDVDLDLDHLFLLFIITSALYPVSWLLYFTVFPGDLKINLDPWKPVFAPMPFKTRAGW